MEARLLGMVLTLLGEVAAESEIELPAELGAETPLFGREGLLDSLALVSLVVALEQAIEDELNCVVALADEKALSARSSPFRTAGTLAAHAKNRVEEAA